ncbi:HAD family hydrolase [Streptomyces coeruleoprunus]|uniref:HAD family hydrolase n=1 Tax=Streptomyces coeruleoprunus TaxID=285563 RepID=A0ABV9XBA1_9ACTN
MVADPLASIVSGRAGILLDFDGPVCNVFAGLPAPSVARDLASLVCRLDASLAEEVQGVEDPMEVHRISQKGGRDLLVRVEDALTQAELAAVEVAGDPVPGADEVLFSALSSRRRVAVVSNNSAECVRAFLRRHELEWLVDAVIGRPAYRPDLMKPSPHLVFQAIEALQNQPNGCVLVGDSVTDAEAALAAGVGAIGYANKPHKSAALSAAGADAVITDMGTLGKVLYDDQLGCCR